MILRTKVRIVGDPERFQKDIYNTFLAFEIECKRRLCKVKGPCGLSEQMRPCVFVCMTKKHLDQREVWIKTLVSLQKQVAKCGLELKGGKLVPELVAARSGGPARESKPMGSRMFPFITKTWNPLGGECQHKCSYCWTLKLIEKNGFVKYQGEPRLIEKELEREFEADDFVFVQDVSDLFAKNVPPRCILRVLDKIKTQRANFLFLTKNPTRYDSFLRKFPDNVVLGVTVETNSRYIDSMNMRFYSEISQAVSPRIRLLALEALLLAKLTIRKFRQPFFVSMEPILDFNLEGPEPRDNFAGYIADLNPWAVAVGYDNYDNKLPEPPLSKTMLLIDRLEKAGITVYRKTLREAWNA